MPLLLVGMLMGPFSSLLFMVFMHFPIVAPELIFIPFFLCTYKMYGVTLEHRVSFGPAIVIWAFFLIIAILWGTWSFMAVLSTGRSFLILSLFYVIGKNIRFDDALARLLLVCSIGSLIGWVIKSYFNLQMLASLDAHEEAVVYGNMVAIAFAFSISLLMRSNYMTVIIIFVINIILCFTSSLRRQISVSVMSMILSLSMMTVRNRKYSYLIVIALISIPVYLVLPKIENAIEETNATMYYRIFERSQNLLEGDLGNSEKGRIDNQKKILEDFPDLIIPHGYVSQQTSRDVGTGIFNDVPLYMLAYSFGILTLFVYIMYYMRNLLITFMRFNKYNNPYYGVIFVVGFVVLFLHFVDAQMFTVSYTAPFTGLTLGLLFRKSLITSKSHYKI